MSWQVLLQSEYHHLSLSHGDGDQASAVLKAPVLVVNGQADSW